MDLLSEFSHSLRPKPTCEGAQFYSGVVKKWRARQDSNLWPLPSEGSSVAQPLLARYR